MITTKIEINGIPIVVVHAVRLTGVPGELCTYECFVMRTDVYQKPYKKILGEIQHYYDDGAETLSKKMLDLYCEKKGKTVG